MKNLPLTIPPSISIYIVIREGAKLLLVLVNISLTTCRTVVTSLLEQILLLSIMACSLPLGLLQLPSLRLNSGVLLASTAPVFGLTGVHPNFPRMSTATTQFEDDVAGAYNAKLEGASVLLRSPLDGLVDLEAVSA